MMVPISERARRFGYFIWPKASDADVRAVLGDVQSVEISFEGTDIGSKKVDWARRRISLGPTQTRSMPDSASTFVLERDKARVILTCR